MSTDPIGRAAAYAEAHFPDCKTAIKLDQLWQCLTDTGGGCPDQLAYGPVRYCMHQNAFWFSSPKPKQKGNVKMDSPPHQIIIELAEANLINDDHDFSRVASALQRGESREMILSMPEVETWPGLFRWLHDRL